MRPAELKRFLKYCAVGVLNTVVTLVVIFVTKSLIGLPPMLCNALGYTAGVINSFLWNRAWVFRSDGKMGREAVKFLLGFGICYAAQFLLVWWLSTGLLAPCEWNLGFFTLSGYGAATLAGNVLYTILNFIYNRLITFSPTN